MFTYLFGRDFSVAISRLMLLSFVAMLPFMGGCGEDDNPIIEDDNPIVEDEHDHAHEGDTPLHANIDGFTLEVDGAEVYHEHQGAHEGGLTVSAGEEIDVHVVFIDENDMEVHLDEVQDAALYTLDLSDYDPAIIDTHLFEGEAEPAEHAHGEELGFEVVGLKVGKTEIKLRLLHGDHADFTAALPIPVTVK